MKIGWLIVVAFLIIIIGYMLFLVIGMSYTYPSIKEYYYGVNKISFDEKLARRIDSNSGWSLEKKDSVKGQEEDCYWISLLYEGDGQKLEYEIKYCLASKASSKGGACIRLEIVGAFDFINKNGGYKSNTDVDKLVSKLDNALLNKLAPECSSNP